MRTIKTEETIRRELRNKILDKIEKSGYIAKRSGSGYYQGCYFIYKGKFKWFQQRPYIIIIIKTDEIKFVDSYYFRDLDGSYGKGLYDFIKEFERKTKLELVKYV